MGQPIDTASVEIVPDFSDFEQAARRGTQQGLRAVAQEAERTFNQVERSAADAGRDIARDFTIAGDIAQNELRQVARSGEIMATKVAASATAAGSAVSSRIGAGAALAGSALLGIGAAAGVAVAAIAGFGLKSAAKLEQTQIGFESLLGSAQEAQDFLKELQHFAAVTPFEFAGIADASRRILAFGQSVGIAKDEVIPTITVIGDLASVLGVGQQEIDAVIRAFGQIASKGRLMGGEVLQLSEALPGFNVNAAIAAKVGLSVADSLKLQEAGAIDAQTAIEGILEGMAQFPGAAGAMIKQSQTLLGVFSTFKDTVSQNLTNAFQPVIPAIKDSLAELTPIIGDALNQLAPAIGGVLSSLLPLLGQFIAAVVPILTPILDVLAGALQTFADSGALQSLADAFGSLFGPLSALGPVVGKVLGALVEAFVPLVAAMAPVVEALIPALIEILQPLIPIIGIVAETLGAVLGPAFQVLAKVVAAVAPFLSVLIKLIGTALRPILAIIGPIIDAVANSLLLMLPALTELFPPLIKLIEAFLPLNELLVALLGVVLPLIEPILTLTAAWIGFLAQSAIVPFIEKITEVVTLLFEPLRRIIEPLQEIKDKFTEFGSDLVDGIIQGIKDAGGKIGDALKNVVKAGLDKAKDFLGISSPSKLLADEVGRWIPPGIAMGIDRGAPALLSTVAGMVGDIAALTGTPQSSSSSTIINVGGVTVPAGTDTPTAARVGTSVGDSVNRVLNRNRIALGVRMLG